MRRGYSKSIAHSRVPRRGKVSAANAAPGPGLGWLTAQIFDESDFRMKFIDIDPELLRCDSAYIRPNLSSTPQLVTLIPDQAAQVGKRLQLLGLLHCYGDTKLALNSPDVVGDVDS